jgi:hypothetical protein
MIAIEGTLVVTVSGSDALGLAEVSRLVEVMAAAGYSSWPGSLLKVCADPAVGKS